jgi:uncharacterized protein (DUF779 family)
MRCAEPEVLTGDRARVVVSQPATEALARLTGKRGPVVFVQSARCVDCGEPSCYRLGDFHPGDTDVRVGEVPGGEVWLDSRLLEVWTGSLVVLDIERGYTAAPTLPAGDGMHFVIRLLPDHAPG